MPFFSFVSPRPAAPVVAPVAPASEAPCVAPAALVSVSGSLAWGGLVGRAVGFSRGGWEASSRPGCLGYVVVWVKPVDSPVCVRVRCAVFASVPRAEVSALVNSLRAAIASGACVEFATRSGWAPDQWFAGVRPV